MRSLDFVKDSLDKPSLTQATNDRDYYRGSTQWGGSNDITNRSRDHYDPDQTYVAGRDFEVVDKANGYVLGGDEHIEPDNRKMSYDIYKYDRTSSYEHNGKTYKQKHYKRVDSLDVSPYAKWPEVKLAFRKAIGDLNESVKKPKKKVVKEDIAADAMRMEKDNEVQMARSQLYRIARDAMNLHDLLRTIPPDTDLEAWVQNKITIAEEYLTKVNNYLQSEEGSPVPNVPQMTGIGETTTAGAVATVSQPLGQTQRRKKRKGTLLGEKEVPKTSRYRVGEYTVVHTNEPNKQGQYQGKVFNKEGELAAETSDDLKDLKEKLKQAALNAHRDALRGAESKGAYITGQDRAAVDFNAAFTREVLGGFEPTAARLVRENGRVYLDVMDQEYFDAFGADKSEGFVKIQNRQATKNETATQLFGMGLSPGRAARLGLENHGVYMLDQTTEGDEMFTRYELDLIGYSDRKTSYPVPTLTVASWIGGMKNGS